MKYSIDRIEDNIAMIQNIETGEKIEINIELLPENIKEGTILKKEEKYTIDEETTNDRKESIQNRFNQLIK